MTTIRVGPGLDDNRPTLNIGFPRVFQTFFFHFHSQNNSISSLKMSFTTSRFQFQTCVKQFQYFVIIFQTSFIDFRRLSCLIRPILRCVMNRRSKFVLFIFKLFFISIRQVLTSVGGFYALVWEYTERVDKRKRICEVAWQNQAELGIH